MWYFKSLKLTPKLNGKWQLLEEVVYTVGYKGSADIIQVPQGFETDWASIPRLLRTIIWNPFDTKFIAARLIHDYLYISQIRNKETADDIFLETLLMSWVGKWKSIVMYQRVKWFGKWEYNKNNKCK